MQSKWGKWKVADNEDFEISVLIQTLIEVLMQRDVESFKDQVKELLEQQVHIANSSIDKFCEELKKQQEKVKIIRTLWEQYSLITCKSSDSDFNLQS